jgi:hypothetical protein
MLLPVALLAGCGSTGAVRGSAFESGSGTGSAATTPAGTPTGSHVLRVISTIPSAGYATRSALYLTQTSPFGEHTGEIYELTSVDPTSGRVQGVRRFEDKIDDLLPAGGSLWVTTGDARTTLWRLDPRTLVLRSRVDVPTTRFAQGIVGSLATAGDELWVGAGELDRVSLATGRVERVITVPYRGPVQLAADPGGRILVASLGFEHPVQIVRLNPRNGEVLSRRAIPRSVSQPTIGGVIDGGVWIENVAGRRTTVARLDLDALNPVRTSALATRANRVSVRVLGGVLWVTEPLGQRNLNYCADPATGRPLAKLPPLPGDSVLLAGDATTIFYTDVPLNAHSVKLETAPISSRCRA